MRLRLLPIAVVAVWTLSGCGGTQSAQSGAPSGSAGVNTPVENTSPGNTVAADDGNAPAANAPAANAPATNAPAAGNAPAAAKPKPGGPVKVVMETSKGTLELELYPDKAPLSVQNFVDYASKGFYNGTLFHRVIRGFMIQGGGYDESGQEKPTAAPVKNEAANGLKNERGTLAMARTPDPDSATSQFFINVAPNASLDRPNPDGFGYTVFGKVTKGMDVVDKIVLIPTGIKEMGGRPSQDVPETPVVIKSVKVAE